MRPKPRGWERSRGFAAYRSWRDILMSTTTIGTAHGADAIAATREDIAKAIVRITVSVLILLHTWAVINGEQAIRDTLMRWDLPVGLAWTAVIFEGIAPILVILGVYARIGAAMMTFWMVMA